MTSEIIFLPITSVYGVIFNLNIYNSVNVYVQPNPWLWDTSSLIEFMSFFSRWVTHLVEYRKKTFLGSRLVFNFKKTVTTAFSFWRWVLGSFQAQHSLNQWFLDSSKQKNYIPPIALTGCLGTIWSELPSSSFLDCFIPAQLKARNVWCFTNHWSCLIQIYEIFWLFTICCVLSVANICSEWWICLQPAIWGREELNE